MVERVGFRVALDTSEAMGGLEGVRSKALLVGGAVAAVGAGILALGAKSFDLANKQLEAETKLAAAIKATGQEASFSAKSVIQLAQERQKLTTFGDEQTIAAAAMLTTFGLEQKAVERLIPAIQDLSAFTGQDLTNSAMQVGKAFSDSITVLKRVGVTLTANQKAAFDAAGGYEKAAILADVLEKNVGGTAVALGEAVGASVQFDNAVGDLLETFGAIIQQDVFGFFESGIGIVEELNRVTREFFELAGSDAARARAVGAIADEAQKTARWLQTAQDQLERVQFLTNVGRETDIADVFPGLAGLTGSEAEDVLLARIFELQVALADLSGDAQEAANNVDGALSGAGKGGTTPPKVDKKQLAADKKELERLLGDIEKDRNEIRKGFDLDDQADIDRNARRNEKILDSIRDRHAAEERAHDKLQRELERAEKKRIREVERAEKDALREREQANREFVQIVQGLTNATIQTTTTLITDLIDGNTFAFEKAALGYAGMVGAQIAAVGWRGIMEGAVHSANPTAPGSGAGMIAQGAAAVAFGTSLAVGSQIGGAVLSRAQGAGVVGVAGQLGITGGIDAVAGGGSANGAFDDAESLSAERRQLGTAVDPSQQSERTLIIYQGPSYGDVQRGVRDIDRDRRRAAKHQLRARR